MEYLQTMGFKFNFKVPTRYKYIGVILVHLK